IEFIPDAPIRDDGQETSILAHNFYWIADQAFHDKLWERVRPYVPEESQGRKVRGINRRFRVYRYVPGAEYRCHIDGAWPPSGIDPVTDKYQYDSSPADARQSSLYTFLIYLNDEFEGGETSFFIPSVREGVMNAYPVKPIMGSVAVFPHGEAQGALLHEGTGVTKGAKYIIRTDVEYDVVASAN
ncbi:prolyl 4-hydroxylase, partial [Aureobasidium melanogenum]